MRLNQPPYKNTTSLMNQPDGAVSDRKQPWDKLTIYYCKAWCSHWKTPGDNSCAAESDAPEGTQLWQTPLGAITRALFECWFHCVRTDSLPCKRKLASVLNYRQTWVCFLWNLCTGCVIKHLKRQWKTIYQNQPSIGIRGPKM